jgi:hypothetical protein
MFAFGVGTLYDFAPTRHPDCFMSAAVWNGTESGGCKLDGFEACFASSSALFTQIVFFRLVRALPARDLPIWLVHRQHDISFRGAEFRIAGFRAFSGRRPQGGRSRIVRWAWWAVRPSPRILVLGSKTTKIATAP